jgi:hypothetical protein
MKYANINTQEIRGTLSPILSLAEGTITGATIEHWAELGWREITQIDEPAAGYRVTAYRIQELGPLTSKLTVASSVNIADEVAANAASVLEQQKTDAKSILDGSSESVRRTLVAFATLTLQEINTLRTKASLPTYTWAQFVAALKSKIDNQT